MAQNQRKLDYRSVGSSLPKEFHLFLCVGQDPNRQRLAARPYGRFAPLSSGHPQRMPNQGKRECFLFEVFADSINEVEQAPLQKA